MKTNSETTPLYYALGLLALCAASIHAQDVLETDPGPVNYGTIPLSQQMEPTRNPYGTSGMSNVISAEPLGAGRLGMMFRGNLYQQSQAMPGTIGNDGQVTTLSFGAGLGLNPYIDGFVRADAYNVRSSGVSGSGLGATALGAQATVPLPQDYPFRLGVQVMTIFGTGDNQINTQPRANGELGAYGYNYLETRGGTDLMVRLAQSFIFVGDESGMGLKLHVNEGIVSSFEPGKGVLLVTGAGAQFIVMPPLVLGMEINSRTFLAAPTITDPIWVTPSVVFRTPSHMNMTAGADISITKDRADGTRTLEPWRAFIALSVSYDTQARMRQQRAEAARRSALEKAMLAQKARQAESDRLAQKHIADSLAVKAVQDSVILAATQRALVAEKSKRSESEEQLLGTGMLLMDAVYFETGRTDISINSKPYLNIIAKMLAKYPKLRTEVSGHSDSVGGASYNQGLSQDRAESVQAYMVNTAPELKGRLSAKGYGLTQPKADNDTEAGRMMNRRIELRILNKDALKEYNK